MTTLATAWLIIALLVLTPVAFGSTGCGRPDRLKTELQTSDRAVAGQSARARVEYVVLLHGLGRSSLSMKGLEWYLGRRGYHVINARYPTGRRSVRELAGTVLDRLLETEIPDGARVHFVTHSQGGILLRQYLAEHEIPNLGRVVMLAPPNHGSELSDILGRNPVTRALVGPGFLELGTGANSLPNRLGPVDFECGVIAGDRSLNPLFSLLLPGPGDGKVTVASAKADGLADFLVVHNSHTWLMWRTNTLGQVLAFLESGRFNHAHEARTPILSPADGGEGEATAAANHHTPQKQLRLVFRGSKSESFFCQHLSRSDFVQNEDEVKATSP
jgi:pimeloyl-ACP methyl ester carboxylesterase